MAAPAAIMAADLACAADWRAAVDTWKYPLDDLDMSKYSGGMSEREKLLTEIEDFIARHEMRPTHFGRLAVNDTAFVRDLRDGRSVRLDMVDRLREFMRGYGPSQKNGRDAHAA